MPSSKSHPNFPFTSHSFRFETFYPFQAHGGGAAAQALSAFALYFATAGQVVRSHDNTPAPLLLLREGRMKEVLGIHTKVTCDVWRLLFMLLFATSLFTLSQRVIEHLFRKAVAFSLECEISSPQAAPSDLLACSPPSPIVADVSCNAPRSSLIRSSSDSTLPCRS